MASNQRRPIIAGNWKMFKTTPEAAAFTEALQKRVQGQPANCLPEIVLCPPFTALTTVRDAAKASGKKVELTLAGADTELDNNIIQQISDPLIHLVRNSVAHGIEREDERYQGGKFIVVDYSRADFPPREMFESE